MKHYDETWEIFYDGLKTIENFNMHYYYVYIIRRLIFVLLAIHLTDVVAFQIMLNIFVNLVNLMFFIAS